MKILVIEDYKDTLNLIGKIIGDKVESVLVESSEDAIKCVDDVDLIITDVALPGINGDVLIHDLREKGNNTPAIIVTGNFKEMQYTEEKNTILIKKPFTMADLHYMIHHYEDHCSEKMEQFES